MKIRRVRVLPLTLLAGIIGALTIIGARADIVIDTVTVGDAGNTADTTGYGAVAYEYNIGKYEVTISQYTSFLNAVAATDTYGLYNPAMATSLNIAGITQTGSSGSFLYTAVAGSENHPIAYITWYNAARFANWVQNGQLTGAQDSSTTEDGAYTLNGATSGTIILKNPDAVWWIPSEDEWYKAAYYKGGGTNAGYWDYPTQSDTLPGNAIGSTPNQANTYVDGVGYATSPPGYDPDANRLTDGGAFSGSAGAYGTFDQGGNVYEWNDAVISGGARGLRGGSWAEGGGGMLSTYRDNFGPPEFSTIATGFRLSTVPEPSTYALIVLGVAAVVVRRRRMS